MPPSPEDCIHQLITMWEGGYQNYREDVGNYVLSQDGQTLIDIGTNMGVTPNALATHRGVQPWSLTPDDMQAITVDEAVDIGIKHYYEEPNFKALVWGPATASWIDVAWGSGPGTAVVHIQRMVGAGVDAQLGPITALLYNRWEAGLGWIAATQAVHDDRQKLIDAIVAANPSDQKFTQGWYNRNDWYSKADAEWWSQWGITA